MKIPFLGGMNLAVATLLLAIAMPARAQNFSADLTPKAVLDVMQHVGDWQLEHATTNANAKVDWIAAAGDTGLMALSGISGDAKYRDAMLALGEGTGWQLGHRKYHADDHCIGQTYAELYFLYREPKMIAPLRERFDYILAHPSDTPSLDFKLPKGKSQEKWSWCDALFMAPSAWLRLYAATGDERYLNFAVTNFWYTTDYLYDKDEHLYFRDSTYFAKQEANGKKVFWARGNGWVFAGLVRILQYLPTNHQDRPRFEQIFKDMADKLLTCQQADGLWRASLLDPDSYPMKETSGSGFYTYGFAWGVNQGLLDRAKFEPAIQKAWTALVGCVEADGKLTHVQPVGADPKKFNEESTAPYGVGGFLLAGSEIYKAAVLKSRSSQRVDESTPFGKFLVKVTNPSNFKRDCETVEIKGLAALSQNASVFSPDQISKMIIIDGVSSRILDSQTYAETDGNFPLNKIFQVDLAPHETRTFYILDASALAAVPPPIVKTFARYVPERHDDFAWESDRIAHRIFGKALETWAEEPLTSSGFDVWIKRTRSLVINDMYHTMKLFNTNAVAQDDFKVGKTRGDGGLGIWDGEKLHVSGNWRNWKLITTGPIRSEFELTYDAWDAGNGRMVSETKRISIDAGSNLSRVESTFSSDDKSPLTIGVGLAERPGENVILTNGAPEIAVWQTSTARGLAVQDQAEGWQTYWQPQDFTKGVTAVAFVLPKGSVQSFTNDAPNLPASKFAAPTHTVGEGQPALRDLMAVTSAEIGRPFVYYFGAGWDMSGDFPNAKSWSDYVSHFAERRDQPLQVTVGN
jgi:unsaturated rhamnogalacturonyl hydrolase